MNRRSRIIEIRMNSRRHNHGLHRERRRWEECFRQVQQAGVRRKAPIRPWRLGASFPWSLVALGSLNGFPFQISQNHHVSGRSPYEDATSVQT